MILFKDSNINYINVCRLSDGLILVISTDGRREEIRTNVKDSFKLQEEMNKRFDHPVKID